METSTNGVLSLQHDNRQSYAIVPAAGISRRMGCCKLLLPWPPMASAVGSLEAIGSADGQGPGTIIDSVLRAWTGSGIDRVVVVLRGDDRPLREACLRWPVHIVHPRQPPADMRASCCEGLAYVQERWAPNQRDLCFIAPADVPTLTAEIVDRLIVEPAQENSIVLPRFGGRNGHPVRLPWSRAREIFGLPPDCGVDSLVRRCRQVYVDFPASALVRDIDTPEQYRLALGQAQAPIVE